MKLFILLTFITISTLSYGQDSVQTKGKQFELIQPGGSETCEAIKEQAAQMAARKEFISVSYGLMPAPMSNQVAFRKYVLDKYNISFESKGCAVTPQDLCYAAAMNAAIEKEYGTDFLQQQYEAFKAQLEKE
ncbi:MAG: hypothetical protein ACSHWW_05210 [Nonlabens sp.]|uniref:hypothetical protein n=1 Tax=Nonlabens sp. TaxID=1888209 RepID=UPI003EF5F1B0